ncbi:hypothetical protein NW762_012846 [Fusarium torreyae]|uniref:Uncharacterized protein n=1 Tax=Fusarium torreyae TaxID=1237075 RepID=A0A9W8RQA7_9HYPO|nr:hypothetical protein NW762_012846 [Fusarium torreyae]
MKSFILLGQLVLLSQCAVSLMNFPSMCLLNPIELDAGLSLISAKITDTHPGPCSVSFYFEDPAFLPITYNFKPLACDGAGLVNFVVPLGVPSGEAYITFQCAGQSQSCHRAFIVGGQSDVDVAVPPLTIVCETAHLDRITTQTLTTTIPFPLATSALHSDTSITTVATKYITDSLIGSRSVTTLTITMTDKVIRNEESATTIHDTTFTTDPIIPNMPSVWTLTETSTPTPRKTTEIGTIGSIGTIGPRATQSKL